MEVKGDCSRGFKKLGHGYERTEVKFVADMPGREFPGR